MPIGKFRITTDTVVLIPEGQLHVAHTLRGGVVITANSDRFAGSKLVEVVWGEKTVMVFPKDLRSRTEPVE